MKRCIAILVLAGSLTASACPMCKDSVPNREGQINELHDASNTNGQNISGGINASVYVMLGTLLGMMGLISTIVVKGIRGSDSDHRKR